MMPDELEDHLRTIKPAVCGSPGTVVRVRLDGSTPAYNSHDEAVAAGKRRNAPFRVVARQMYVAEPIELRDSPVQLSRDHLNYVPIAERWVKITPKGDGGQAVTVE
jgi:hypothetical protein